MAPPQCFSAKVPTGIARLETYLSYPCSVLAQAGVHRVHERPNDERPNGRSNILSGGNGMVDRHAQRRGNWHFRLGCKNVLLFLGILPLILMIFWLFRVRFTNAYKGKSMPRR